MKKFTKISGALLFASVMVFGLAVSCDDDEEGDQNAGKTDPGTIATANLVAYFPFNGDALEEIENLTPEVANNVTYVAGRRGQAYQGAVEAHLLYDLPGNSKLGSLTSFSIATWFRSPLVTGDPEPIFFQVGRSDDLFWGNLTLAMNRLSATADSLQFKVFFYKEGVPWAGQHIGFSDESFLVNKWMHVVFLYDAATSKFMIYKDGAKVETNEGVENRYAAGEDVTPRPPLGPLAFTNADVINIGAWRPKTEGAATDAWMGWFMGNLDELRVYDKALSATEVKSLYDAEVSQLTE